MAEPDLEHAPRVLVLPELEHLEQQVVEVDRVLLRELPLVERVHALDHVVEHADLHGGRIDAAVLRAIEPRQHRARRHLIVEPRLLEQLLDELHLIVVVEDHEAAGQPDPLAELAQQARAGRVERADPHRIGPRSEQCAQAMPHLGGRFVRECDREDAARIRAGIDQVRDPVDQDACLSRAGAGQHHQRAIAMLDGRPLLGIQKRAIHGAALAFTRRADTEVIRPPSELLRRAPRLMVATPICGIPMSTAAMVTAMPRRCRRGSGSRGYIAQGGDCATTPIREDPSRRTRICDGIDNNWRRPHRQLPIPSPMQRTVTMPTRRSSRAPDEVSRWRR